MNHEIKVYWVGPSYKINIAGLLINKEIDIIKIERDSEETVVIKTSDTGRTGFIRFIRGRDNISEVELSELQKQIAEHLKNNKEIKTFISDNIIVHI